MKKGVVVNPSEFSDNHVDFLKKHCAILIGESYKTPLSTDELVTGQYIYLSNSLPFHGAVIVVDNLTDFHSGMPKDFCQKLVDDKDYKFKAVSGSGNEFNNVSGFSERLVFHREHGLQHQLLCSNFGEAAWVNVTGMEVFLEKSVMQNKEVDNKPQTKTENEDFIKDFMKEFERKISLDNPSVNVKVADYRDAKSHLNDMVRDLSQCVNNKERMFWLKTTERMFFEYRTFSCKRATPRDHELFQVALNRISDAMEGCLKKISSPDQPRKKINIHELPPESKRMLDLNKVKNREGDPSP